METALSKLDCFIVSRDSWLNIYVCIAYDDYCWSIICFAHALIEVTAALLAVPSWLTFCSGNIYIDCHTKLI